MQAFPSPAPRVSLSPTLASSPLLPEAHRTSLLLQDLHHHHHHHHPHRHRRRRHHHHCHHHRRRTSPPPRPPLHHAPEERAPEASADKIKAQVACIAASDSRPSISSSHSLSRLAAGRALHTVRARERAAFDLRISALHRPFPPSIRLWTSSPMVMALPFNVSPHLWQFWSLALALLACAIAYVFRARLFNPTPKNKPLHIPVVQPLQQNDGVDIIIVGAGVAGSALAHTLGMDGRKVFVIERDLSEPDRIVGELLQPGGYLKLVELGLADCVEEIDAQRVLGYALFKDGKDTKVGYPLEGYGVDVAGRSFHNGRFIQRMRNKGAKLPTVTFQQGTALSLVEEEGAVKGVKYRVAGGNEREVYAPLTIVCDGCFSNLRRTLCTSKPEVPSCFVGLVLENCELPYSNHGHVVLADPSPILFYPISSTEVRCLVDIPGEKVPSIANGEMAKYLKSVVAPQLPKQLQVPFIAAIEKGHIRSMPNKSMPAFPVPRPGALLMGDAFNMRHPLTGGGMTVALSDVVVLRNLLRPLCDLHDATALCAYLEKFYTLRKPVASTINTLAGALYKVFCASPDLAMKEMRQACFDYLSLGGVFSSGPVALLSGLNPRPMSLVGHFFAVAIYGVGRLLIPPSPKKVWLGIRLLKGASNIIFPIIKAEGVRKMFFPNTVPAYYRVPPSQGD